MMGAIPTPGPWWVSANAARASEWLVLTDDDLVATCDGASPEANAQLIVTAVNAHDALVAVLRDLEWCEHDMRLSEAACPRCHGIRNLRGHHPHCKLAAVLAAAGVSPTDEQVGADHRRGTGG